MFLGSFTVSTECCCLSDSFGPLKLNSDTVHLCSECPAPCFSPPENSWLLSRQCLAALDICSPAESESHFWRPLLLTYSSPPGPWAAHSPCSAQMLALRRLGNTHGCCLWVGFIPGFVTGVEWIWTEAKLTGLCYCGVPCVAGSTDTDKAWHTQTHLCVPVCM